MLDGLTITIKMRTGNEAFTDDRESEVCRVLKDVVAYAARVQTSGEKNLYDFNGNIVGTLEVKRGR